MPRVLVVDDEPDIRALIEFRLRKAGHQVLAVGSAAEALDVVDRRGAPDVAILDVAMPVVDGFTLLGELRKRKALADLPAIFLSARVLPDDIATGRAAGATYLTKPFVAPALLAAIERALGDRAVSSVEDMRAGEAGW